MSTIRLRVRVVDGDTEFRLEIAVSPTDLLAEVIERIIQYHKLPGTIADWNLYLQGRLLSPDLMAEQYKDVELLMSRSLVLRNVPIPELQADDSISEIRLDLDEAKSKPTDIDLDDLAEMANGSGFQPPAPAPKRRRSAGEAPAASIGMESAAPTVNRRATVRYYSRMNPQRTYPFLVILSAEQIAEIVKKRVKQVEGTAFEVKAGSLVEIEPILPGCQCFPPRETITIGNEAVNADFWVVPQVLGAVQGARVVVRQGGIVLSEVKLEMRVSKQTLTTIFGLLGLVSPYLTMGLKQLKHDPDSQKQQNFELYRRAGSWVVENLQPEYLGFGLLGLAVLCYFWLRPRQRDVFWDITTQPATVR